MSVRVFDSILSKQRSPAHSTPAEIVGALYELHRLAIYRFLVAQGMSPAVAQEMAQDVFVRLFTAISKGTEILSKEAWLYRVASRIAVDYWRREGRSMWVELDSLPLLMNELSSNEPLPETTVLKNDRLKRVAKAMAALPKEQRLAIQLRMQGLPYREIAKILEVSISTAADWLSIAVERLRSAANE